MHRRALAIVCEDVLLRFDVRGECASSLARPNMGERVELPTAVAPAQFVGLPPDSEVIDCRRPVSGVPSDSVD